MPTPNHFSKFTFKLRLVRCQSHVMPCAQVLLDEVCITLNFGIAHQTGVVIYLPVGAHTMGLRLAVDLSDMPHDGHVVTILFAVAAFVSVGTVPGFHDIPTCGGVGFFESCDTCVSLLL